MIIKKFNFIDEKRDREIPIIIYSPKIETNNIVIYNPGYGGGPEAFIKCQNGERKYPFEQAEYLAKFFTNKGYNFISIQHDLITDQDGLETLNWKDDQKVIRRHLWERSEKNILFIIEELKKECPKWNLNKFIIGGHSNGADSAKFFANNHCELISHVISLDGRRCPVDSNAQLKLLMFEANETLPDDGVIPNKRNPNNYNDAFPDDRKNLEWVIIKPKNAKLIAEEEYHCNVNVHKNSFR